MKCNTYDCEEEACYWENVEGDKVKLCKGHAKGMTIYQDKEDVINQYFPKGDPRRGEALVVLAQAYLDGQKAFRLALRTKLGDRTLHAEDL